MLAPLENYYKRDRVQNHKDYLRLDACADVSINLIPSDVCSKRKTTSLRVGENDERRDHEEREMSNEYLLKFNNHNQYLKASDICVNV